MQLLAVSAILTTGRRTLANFLRNLKPLVNGAASSYNRVLTNAHWSGLALAALLLRRLLQTLLPTGSSITLIGDDTAALRETPFRAGVGISGRPGVDQNEGDQATYQKN